MYTSTIWQCWCFNDIVFFLFPQELKEKIPFVKAAPVDLAKLSLNDKQPETKSAKEKAKPSETSPKPKGAQQTEPAAQHKQKSEKAPEPGLVVKGEPSVKNGEEDKSPKAEPNSGDAIEGGSASKKRRNKKKKKIAVKDN